MIITILILAVLAGCLYRRGGTSAGTLWRDVGVSAATLLTCLILGLTAGLFASIIAYFLTFGLSWAANSSYFGQDEKRFGYIWHGLALSLALLPIAYITGHWLGFGIRTIVLTAFITLWSEYMTWDIGEEFGRGFLIVISLSLLLIG